METQNLEWLIFNALHGDVNGDIPEDLQVMIKAEQELSALLARHDALVEAVAWERECEELHGIITELYCNVAESAPEEDEISMTYFAACAEVDRLLQEEK